MMTDRKKPSLMNRVSWRLVCANALLLGAYPLGAQTDAPDKHVCGIVADEPDADGARLVRAACWGTGLELGKAEAFQTLTNPELGAALVGLEYRGDIRILLLREGADGQPMIEDLKSLLTSAAGRGPLGNLDGLPIDFTQFETSGVIAVGETGEEAGEGEAISSGAEQAGRGQFDEVGSGSSDTVTPGAVDIGALIANDPANAVGSDQ